MAIQYGQKPDTFLSDDELEAWRNIPTSIIGDELNRTFIMDSGIKPITPHTSIAGHALTVDCMVADNSSLHYALMELWPGAVIVGDGRGHTDTAMWGEIMHSCAEHNGAAGVILDGAMRDFDTISSSGLPAYCRGVSPRGPHKGWGGNIHMPIQCGRVPVNPGDLIVADQDGVAVIAPDLRPGLMDRCLMRIENETRTLERVALGEFTVDILGFPPAEKVGG